VAAPRPSGSERQASELGARWVRQLERAGVLEAYELRSGDDDSLGFAVARKAFPGEVRLLIDVARPRHLDEVALLALRRAGRPAEIFSYATSQLYGRGPGGPAPGTVVRVPSIAQGLRRVSAAAHAVELLLPVLPGDYAFEWLGDDAVAGTPCQRIRAVPARAAVREMELCISVESAVALRRRLVAEDGTRLVVETSVDQIREVGDRFVALRQYVRTSAGEEAELHLVNVLSDVELPDRMFTRRNLRRQRFPSF